MAATQLEPALAEAERADRRAAQELDLLLADLERWVAHDSPSGVLPALDTLAEDIAETARRYGLAAELVPADAGLHVHASLEGSGRARVALLGHHDTVFPLGTTAARPFRRLGSHVVGPGVADMKGGLAVALHTARLLAGGDRPFARVELVSVPDEEPRSIPFATLDRLAGFDAVLCFECGRPGNAVVTARKGGSWLELAAVGRAAHAGAEPERGRNAVVALAREALRIAALDGARDGFTVHVTSLHGGDVPNTIPAVARLTVDVRAWARADLEWALEEIGRFGEHDGVAVEIAAGRLTPPLERTSAVVELAGAAALIGERLGFPVAETATGGVSDACWTAAAGIPSIDGLGPVGGLDHTPDEFAEVDSFAQRCALAAGLVAAIDVGLLRESDPYEDVP